MTTERSERRRWLYRNLLGERAAMRYGTLAGIGLVCMLLGRVLGNDTLHEIGSWLLVPLAALVAITVLILMPYFYWQDRRRER